MGTKLHVGTVLNGHYRHRIRTNGFGKCIEGSSVENSIPSHYSGEDLVGN